MGSRLTMRYDGNGNIIAWIDQTGTVVERIDYDPFGRVLTRQGGVEGLAFGFSTKYTDSETGLCYYGFRYYDPVTGRWPSRDPIGERGGLNLYAMVGNNSINLNDFLGLAYDTEEQAADKALLEAWKAWVSGIKSSSSAHLNELRDAFDNGKVKELTNSNAWMNSNDARRTEYGGLLFELCQSGHPDDSNGDGKVYDFTGPISGNSETGTVDTSAAGTPSGGGWTQIGSYHTHPSFNPHRGNAGPFSTEEYSEDGTRIGDIASTDFGETNYMVEPDLTSYKFPVPERPDPILPEH